MASYLYETDTSDGTATVPTGRFVKRFSCLAGGSGGTITITPKGLDPLPVIEVPASQPFSEEFTTDPRDPDAGTELPGGSTLAFAGFAVWFVRYV